jgi:hypothetical protein
MLLIVNGSLSRIDSLNLQLLVPLLWKRNSRSLSTPILGHTLCMNNANPEQACAMCGDISSHSYPAIDPGTLRGAVVDQMFHTDCPVGIFGPPCAIPKSGVASEVEPACRVSVCAFRRICLRAWYDETWLAPIVFHHACGAGKWEGSEVERAVAARVLPGKFTGAEAKCRLDREDVGRQASIAAKQPRLFTPLSRTFHPLR